MIAGTSAAPRCALSASGLRTDARLRFFWHTAAVRHRRLRSRLPTIRIKFLHRKVDALKHRTGILWTAVSAAALLRRQTQVICRHQKLYIAFQPNDRKLTQRDEQLLDITGKNQLLIKHTS